MARRRGSDAGQSRRRWVKSCWGCPQTLQFLSSLFLYMKCCTPCIHTYFCTYFHLLNPSLEFLHITVTVQRIFPQFYCQSLLAESRKCIRMYPLEFVLRQVQRHQWRCTPKSNKLYRTDINQTKLNLSLYSRITLKRVTSLRCPFPRRNAATKVLARNW